LIEAGIAHPRFNEALNAAATIVVPVHNNPEGLEALLSSLGDAGGEARIVVDDGSDDAVAVAEVARRHGAQVVRNDVPTGPGGARNRGWQLATTPFVAFIDSDCRARPRWYEPLIGFFAEPSTAIVAPRVVAAPGRAPDWLAAYEATRSPLDRGPVEAPVRPRSRVPFLPAAAMVVRRAAIEQMGGFDESMPVGEDVDLVWRAVEQGWRARYVPVVEVEHDTRASLSGWLAQRFRYGTSAAPLDQRHRRAAAPLVMSGWTALVWVALALGKERLAVVTAAGTTLALARRLAGLPHPIGEAFRLAGRGHLGGGRLLADALRRSWWPLLALAAWRSRRARHLLGAVAFLPLLEWSNGSRRPSAAIWWILRVSDDLAYGAGVWWGCIQTKHAGALLPDLGSWPGRRPAVEPAG
jgi:mycofactocin system glycosyltransferase